jgi:signal peptidase I
MKRGVHAVAWVVLAVAAFLLWPERWGGTMTYVITSGTSMQPMFSAGDLAVLRSADDYDVGDVVAYRSAELDRIVMHRVLTDDGGTYTFRGDNNEFADPEELGDDQVLGELALRVPKVGLVAEWLLRPVNLLLAVAALYLLAGDRRPKDPTVTAVGIGDLQIPEATCVADVLDERELARLATDAGRPVLRNDATGESFVHDGAMVYRHRAPVPEPAGASEPQYAARADAGLLLPRPRRADATIVCGLDLARLLRRG